MKTAAIILGRSTVLTGYTNLEPDHFEGFMLDLKIIFLMEPQSCHLITWGAAGGQLSFK